MLITIDVGNSFIKLAVWQQAEIVHRGFTPYNKDKPSLDHLFASAGDIPLDTRIIVSSVSTSAVSSALTAWCAARQMPAPEFFSTTASCCGVTHSYKDPSRHGVDRWAACIAAHALYDGTVCIVDAGTAITFDVIDAGGQHLGGAIAPGFDLMFDVITSRLALVNHEEQSEVIENDTTGAIQAGCTGFSFGGVDWLLREMKQRYGEDLLVVFTGGQGGDEFRVLDELHRCVLQPDLVMHGLRIYAEQA